MVHWCPGSLFLSLMLLFVRAVLSRCCVSSLVIVLSCFCGCVRLVFLFAVVLSGPGSLVSLMLLFVHAVLCRCIALRRIWFLFAVSVFLWACDLCVSVAVALLLSWCAVSLLNAVLSRCCVSNSVPVLCVLLWLCDVCVPVAVVVSRSGSLFLFVMLFVPAVLCRSYVAALLCVCCHVLLWQCDVCIPLPVVL